jgi:inward rectifier potassium channel
VENKPTITAWRRMVNGGGKKQKLVESGELGFGTRAGNVRLVNPDGSFNVRRVGDTGGSLADLYHNLISISWPRFFVILFIGFLMENLLFATIYYLIGTEHLSGVIAQTELQKFTESFFFSSQTLTTLGYGRISPVGFWTSTVAAIESAIGLLAFALSTSLLWGRFSRPTAKLLYTENALVAPYRGGRGLMVRLVNARSNHLIELEAQVTLARNEHIDGREQRKFYNLSLELQKVNYLALSWTLVHPIDESSPLLGLSQEEIDAANTEILVNLKAFDEMYAQTVYSRTSYKAEQIVCGAKFITMMSTAHDGVTILDIDKLNSFETAGLPE